MNKRLAIGITLGAIIGIVLLTILYFSLFAPKDDATNPIVDVFRSFFPGGAVEDTNIDPTFGNNFQPMQNPQNPDAPIPKLRLITAEWVAGYMTYDRSSTTNATSSFATSSRVNIIETAIRYIERARGHVLETTERDVQSTKLSIVTLPKIQEAYFGNKDTLVARRFNPDSSEVETFVGSLVKTSTTSPDTFELKGSYLSPNISSIAVLGNKMFSLYGGTSGASGYITTPLGGKEVLVFNSPLSSWLVNYVSDNFVAFTSKPSSTYPGNLFLFNTTSKSLSKILGPINGLLASVSPDQTSIIYTESIGRTFNTFYKNNKENTVIGLQSKTFPEKCVWSKNPVIVYCAVPESVPSALYPDDWFKGLVSFTDKIVKIDLSTNTETVLVSLQRESDRAIDATDIKLDDRERFIYFVNKIDGSLWSYDLR